MIQVMKIILIYKTLFYLNLLNIYIFLNQQIMHLSALELLAFNPKFPHIEYIYISNKLKSRLHCLRTNFYDVLYNHHSFLYSCVLELFLLYFTLVQI